MRSQQGRLLSHFCYVLVSRVEVDDQRGRYLVKEGWE